MRSFWHSPFRKKTGARIALRRFRSPGLHCGCFGRPPPNRIALQVFLGASLQKFVGLPSAAACPSGEGCANRTAPQSSWALPSQKILHLSACQNDCMPPSGLPRLLGAVRFAAGRPKYPQRCPGDRNLRNAIQVPPPPPNGRAAWNTVLRIAPAGTLKCAACPQPLRACGGKSG